MQTLTHSSLTELISYNKESGIFTWLVNRNKTRIGDTCGHKSSQGYVRICLNYKMYLAHRLAWFYVTKTWPDQQIDHINGVRDDNRFCNLRDVSNSENQQNQTRAQKDSASGLLGVYRNGENWKAVICINQCNTHLGTYATKELAYEAYLVAKRELHSTNTL